MFGAQIKAFYGPDFCRYAEPVLPCEELIVCCTVADFPPPCLIDPIAGVML